jgi:hypothetical protein
MIAQLQSESKYKESALTGSVLQRKCACGNHTIGGVECESCGRNQIQTKLAISQPGDAHEREADHVADAVINGQSGVPATIGSIASIPTARVQRHASLDARANETATDAISSSGQSLDSETRGFMESRFGVDFSHVRVHTDAKSAESASAVNARAYTVGRDVVFGNGRYAPQTSEGRRLLAHELTHVVQQSGPGRVAPGTLQRAPDGPLPVVVVSGPAAMPKIAEDAAEKNIRTAGAKAEKAGLLRFVPTSGYDDFVKNAHKILKGNECASKVLINGHGGSDVNSAWMTMGSSTDPKRGWGTTDIGNNAGTLIGDDVFKNFKFCKPCEVWMGGCDFAANKPGLLFMQKVANATGCTAKAYATEVTTNPDTGWIESVSGGGKKKKPPQTP